MTRAPALSVLIPFYNEAGNVHPVIDEVHATLEGIDFEIVCVDDCSADATREELAEKLLTLLFDLLPAERGVILLADPKSNSLRQQAARLRRCGRRSDGRGDEHRGSGPLLDR